MSENLIGATTAVFPIRLSVAVTSPVDVEWATRDGSAIAGSDYKAASGTVTFLPGETEKQIEVQVYGQAITPADDKVFFIRLNPPSNAVLVDAILTCTINIIDDQGIPSVAVVVAEGRRGPKGDPGLSAYEQAVLMGYTGTLTEWMDQIADASKAADRAEDYAISAGEDALKAQNAAKNAVFAGVIFPTTAEGVDPILGVQNGAYFNVRSPLSEHYIDEYQNVNGVAVATGKSYPTSAHFQNISEHTALPFVPGESYALNRRVQLDNGDIVKSTINGNTNDPNVDMTGWEIRAISSKFSIDDLRKTRGHKNNQMIETVEYASGSGYGGSLYQWDSSSNADDDGFSVIAVTGISTGRWKLLIKDRVLKATQAGVIADLFSTDKVNQASIIQKCVDYMAKIGGGTVQLPTGHIYAKVIAKANVHIIGTLSPYVTSATDSTMTASREVVNTEKVQHGTFLHSTASTDTIFIGENIDNVTIKNLELKPERMDGGLCGFGIRHGGRNGVFENLKGEGFRFEPMYVRGKDDPNHRGGTCVNTKILNCEFGNSARNSFALIYCSDVYIKNCDFYQLDTGITWAYLWDIEPNPNTTDTVYNVTIDGCTFNTVLHAGTEPTVIVKELNTPNGTPNVKFLNCKFKGYATIRPNSAIGWKDCVVDNCEFDDKAFSTTTSGYKITSGKFTNNKMHGINAQYFAYNTIFGGDFVIEGNVFENISFTTSNLTGASFGLNTYNGSSTVVSPVDRRTITAQYRTVTTVAEVVSPASAPLPAISYTAVRQANLTTTLTDILTLRIRSGAKITITGCDANDGTGSKAFVELYANSDNSTTVTAANEIMNPATYGLTFAWNGRTLQLASKSAAANQFIVKVEVLSALPQYKDVAWLI